MCACLYVHRPMCFYLLKFLKHAFYVFSIHDSIGYWFFPRSVCVLIIRFLSVPLFVSICLSFCESICVNNVCLFLILNSHGHLLSPCSRRSYFVCLLVLRPTSEMDWAQLKCIRFQKTMKSNFPLHKVHEVEFFILHLRP